MTDDVEDHVTIAGLRARKAAGRKIVGVVAWDTQLAQLAERAGADLVSAGDTVGVNLWGHTNPFEVTLDEMVLVCRAVRRGVTRALVSCDFPYGPLQQGTASAVAAAIRLVKEAGPDLVKLDGAADFPAAVEAVTRAGVPVFAQLGITPQTALRHGMSYSPDNPAAAASADLAAALTEQLVGQARQLESAGAVLLNLTNAGPQAGAAVVAAVDIPVVGGFGGGPWLDGRMRMATAAIGYSAAGLDRPPPGAYANVAQVAYDALSAYAADVRAGRQLGRPHS